MIIDQVYGVHRQKTRIAAELTTSPGRGGGSLEILTFLLACRFEGERHASGRPPPSHNA